MSQIPNRITEEHSDQMNLTGDKAQHYSLSLSTTIISQHINGCEDYVQKVKELSNSQPSNILGKRLIHDQSHPQGSTLLLEQQVLLDQQQEEQGLLNEIFDKSPRKKKNDSSYASSTEQENSKRKQKNQRKTSQQLQALERFFKTYNNPWTQEVILKLARQTGLHANQVYKWGWDQRNKLLKRLRTKIEGQDDLSSDSIQNSILNDDQQNKILLQFLKSNTDEFGGYSKPPYQTSPENQKDGSICDQPLLDTRDDDSLCKIVGIDIDQKMKELLKTILPDNNIQSNQKFEKSNGVTIKPLNLNKVMQDQTFRISDKLVSEKFTFDQTSTAANSSRLTTTRDHTSNSTSTLCCDQSSLTPINIHTHQNLKCNEELISDTLELDCQLDKVGDSLRKELQEYKKIRQDITITSNLEIIQQQDPHLQQVSNKSNNDYTINQQTQTLITLQDLSFSDLRAFRQANFDSQMIAPEELIRVGSSIDKMMNQNHSKTDSDITMNDQE